jgi:hypothetical protein
MLDDGCWMINVLLGAESMRIEVENETTPALYINNS